MSLRAIKSASLIFIVGVLLASPTWAAISATTVWEVRTAGSDNNGGAFDPSQSGAGTDYSQQNAARGSGTNLTVDATTNTLVAPDGYTPASADIGNYVQITAGTGFTTGFYRVTAITSGKWSLDRSPAATGTAGGTWAMGGGLATPGKACGANVAGNTIFVLAGTYTLSSTTANGAGGRPSPTGGTNPTVQTTLCGYSTTRTVVNADASHAVFQAGVNSLVAVTLNGYSFAHNIDVTNPSAFTSCTGFSNSGSWNVYESCSASALATGFGGSVAGARYATCKATTCGLGFAVPGQSQLHACVVMGYTSEGINCSGNNYITVVDCIVANGAGNRAFDFGTSNWCAAVNCVAANNAGASAHGFYLVSSNGIALVDCIAYGNGAFGIYTSGVGLNNCMVWNAGVGSNAGGNVDSGLAAQAQRSIITLTASPFTNPGAGDYSLNTTAGGGAALRGAGFPASFPGLSTSSFPDVGAAQHQASGGGYRPRPRVTSAPRLVPILEPAAGRPRKAA